jgi:hypothetical protein
MAMMPINCSRIIRKLWVFGGVIASGDKRRNKEGWKQGCGIFHYIVEGKYFM